MNSPFYAYGCSYLDVVSARKNASDDLVFDRVVTKSGHATYRIIVKDALRFAAAWQPLELKECTYEGLESRVYSVDLPPGTDLDAVRDSLKAAKDTGIWDYEAADLPPMKPSLGDTMNPTQGKQ